MKNWEERFDKKFEGELWLGKYIDVDENGNQYVHRLELKDFIRRLLEEQAKDICNIIDDIELAEHDSTLAEWKQYKHIRNAIRDKYISKAGLSQPATRHGEEEKI